MGIFKGKGIKGKRQSQGGRWILPGRYRVRVEVCKPVVSQKNKMQVFFCAELLTLESTNPEREPGSKMSFSRDVTTSEYPDLSLGDINAFLFGAYSSLAAANGVEGPEEDDIDDEMADDAVGKENPLGGVELDLLAEEITTQNDAKFTRCTWSVPKELLEAAA